MGLKILKICAAYGRMCFSFIVSQMKTGLTNCPERDEARRKGEKFYFIEKPCRNGHVSKRYVSGGVCWMCACLRVEGTFHTASTSVAEALNSIKTSVYVIEAGEFVKIGIAENVATRLQVLRSHCPIPARMVYCTVAMPRMNALRIEALCHESLKSHHCHGEWFKVMSDMAVGIVKGMEPISGEVEKSDPAQESIAFAVA